MAQFTVCRNKNPQTRSIVPFLLDVQNDLLDDLETRVVLDQVRAVDSARLVRRLGTIDPATMETVLSTLQGGAGGAPLAGAGA